MQDKKLVTLNLRHATCILTGKLANWVTILTLLAIKAYAIRTYFWFLEPDFFFTRYGFILASGFFVLILSFELWLYVLRFSFFASMLFLFTTYYILIYSTLILKFLLF